MSTVTIGEALARRRLKQSKMVSGQVLYVPGQYHAARLSDEDCTVSWVDSGGTVNILPCELNKDDEWVRKGIVIVANADGQVWARNIPRGTRLTGVQIDAIMEKYTYDDDEEEEDPPSPGPDDEESSQGAGEQ